MSERDNAARVSRPSEPVKLPAGFESEWPGANSAANECVLLLRQLQGQAKAYGEGLMHANGLPSTAAFTVLTILHGAGEPLPPSVIAERMLVSRPTVSGVLQSLESRGLVQRRPHPSDGRVALIEATPAALALVTRLRPLIHAEERRWMSCLSGNELRWLAELLRRLYRNGPEPPGAPAG